MMSMATGPAERPTSGATPDALAAQLTRVRGRTLALTKDLTDQQFMGPMLPIVNPILWEVGHVGWFHELWTLRQLDGGVPLIARADALWDSSNVAHRTRWDLDLPSRADVLGYMAEVTKRQIARLERGIDANAGYFYELALAHEDMHCEALSYTRQTLGYRAPEIDGTRADSHLAGTFEGDVDIPGGTWWLGSTPSDGFVFDNEKWAHPVEVAPFRIARAPVTNAAFAAFVEDGGYAARSLWSAEGWAWRQGCGAERPVYWQPKSDDGWTWRRFDRVEALDRNAPVAFVNWFEADAFCRWAGRRLPSEAEWEAAALGEASAVGGSPQLAGRKRRWPWGDAAPDPERANIDHRWTGPLPVAALAAGDSAFGCRQMIGNVWEWTASDFLPFGGFSPDPYADYSAPWFGTRKVLKGGAWATHARLANGRYRNFFTPDRRDVIAGFRTCAA